MSTASGNRITSELRAAMGRESAPVTSPDEISRSELRRHIQAIIEDDPIFWDEAAAKSRYGGLVCPGSFPITFTGRRPNGTPDPLVEWPEGSSVAPQQAGRVPWPKHLQVFHAFSRLEVYQLARLGERLTHRRRIAEAYEKPGRAGPLLFVATENSFLNDSGELLCTEWYVDVGIEGRPGASAPVTAPATASLQRHGPPAPPRRDTPLFYDDVEVGLDIPSLPLNYTFPVMVRWCGATETLRRDHFDYEYATKELGLPNAIGSGYWTQARLWKFLHDWVGYHGWVWKVTHQLRNHILPNQTMTLWGVVAGKREEEGLGYVDLDVYMEGQDGMVISPGSATVVLPLRGGRPVPYPFPKQG